MNDQQPEERLAGLRQQALDGEAQLVHLLAGVRATISEVEEIERAARIEISRREFKVYTEKQVAEIFQLSEDSIFRLRKAGKIHCLRLNSSVRYTHEHLIEIADAMERPKPKTKH